MGRNLLPIRILLHATFAFIYLPIIVLGVTWGLNRVAQGDTGVLIIQKHIDGIAALAALVGLGIFAAL